MNKDPGILQNTFLQARVHLAIVIAALMAYSIHALAGESARQLSWEDLTVEVSFEDPFEALSQEQLMDLSLFARVQGLLAADRSKVNEAMQVEANEAVARLQDQKVDVEGLLAQREEIKQRRSQRAQATNPDLAGHTIRMPGYALPLEYDGKKVSEFLLVPWVGACIHTPPPPANQIVHVICASPVKIASRFQPVWIEGTLRTESVKKNLYLVDGAADIHIAYTMSAAKVEKYTKQKS